MSKGRHVDAPAKAARSQVMKPPSGSAAPKPSLPSPAANTGGRMKASNPPPRRK